MARSIIKSRFQATKWKRGRLAKANDANKRIKKSQKFEFLSCFWACLSQKQ